MVAVATAAVVLSSCGSPGPAVTSGRVIDKVEHDDVEIKERVCVDKRTQRYTVNGKTKTRLTCARYKMVEREISPEWFELKLKNRNGTGWVTVDEDTFENYDEGDQYP